MTKKDEQKTGIARSGFGTGRDCVKARHELNKTITNEEIMAGVLKLQAEDDAAAGTGN